MSKRTLGILIFFASLLVCGLSPVRGETPLQEYQVKAAFLYNFVKFLAWPTESFEEDQSPIQLCILGTDPFGPALKMIQDKTVRGRGLLIKQCQSIQQIRGCHVLFLCSSEKKQVRQVLNALSGSNILTVSEMERFGQQGGMINFLTIENRIRFEINPEAIHQAGLKISSHLLKLAKIVQTER